MEAAVVEEIKNFTKVWIIAFAAQTFCYFVIKQIPKGLLRLISLVPIFCLFFYLPLTIKSIHFITIAAFFLTWLGSFKLLLFAFNKGPIGDPSIPFHHFIPISCLPISINPSKNPSTKGLRTPLNYITKTLLLGLIIKFYEYRPFLHQNLISVLYVCHLYLAIEIVLALSAYPARAVFGFEIEPQFQDPFLSTSLQDFWGWRWNLMVPTILRPTVYLPVRGLLSSRGGTSLGRTGPGPPPGFGSFFPLSPDDFRALSGRPPFSILQEVPIIPWKNSGVHIEHPLSVLACRMRQVT